MDITGRTSDNNTLDGLHDGFNLFLMKDVKGGESGCEKEAGMGWDGKAKTKKKREKRNVENWMMKQPFFFFLAFFALAFFSVLSSLPQFKNLNCVLIDQCLSYLELGVGPVWIASLTHMHTTHILTHTHTDTVDTPCPWEHGYNTCWYSFVPDIRYFLPSKDISAAILGSRVSQDLGGFLGSFFFFLWSLLARVSLIYNAKLFLHSFELHRLSNFLSASE